MQQALPVDLHSFLSCLHTGLCWLDFAPLMVQALPRMLLASETSCHVAAHEWACLRKPELRVALYAT